jgi:hypothetical protein
MLARPPGLGWEKGKCHLFKKQCVIKIILSVRHTTYTRLLASNHNRDREMSSMMVYCLKKVYVTLCKTPNIHKTTSNDNKLKAYRLSLAKSKQMVV